MYILSFLGNSGILPPRSLSASYLVASVLGLGPLCHAFRAYPLSSFLFVVSAFLVQSFLTTFSMRRATVARLVVFLPETINL
jgi:hypothetical protein